MDQETGELFDYRHKSVAGVELLLPDDAPQPWKDLQALIANDKQTGVQKFSNIAEAHEKRVDAQVYREYEFALPRELTDDENKTLAREFVQDQICGLGMAAKLNFHFDVDEEGNRFPHVHVVMLTRRLEQNGLSRLKERDWNRKDLAKEWRSQFCDYANFHFKQKGIDITLDPRSYAEQGIDLEPQVKIGKNVSEMEARANKLTQAQGVLTKPSTDRLKDYNEVKLSNQFTIIKNPQVVIDEITSKQTTFTERDIHKVLNRYIDDRDLHQKLVGDIKSLKSVIEISSADDGKKTSLYTTKDLIQREQSFLSKLTDLQKQTGHSVSDTHISKEIDKTNQVLSHKHNSSLSSDQIEALKAMVSDDRLVFVEGYAGSGKTTVVETAANIWKSEGYNVVGLSPTNKAKEGLKGAGIDAYTVHSFLRSYGTNRQQFNENTVLVLDEAGMVDLKRYTGLLNAVDELGVKLVSLGDRGQLTPVEAGCPFTMASHHYDFTKLTSIIRQKESWQKEATQAFGDQNGLKGLQNYLTHGNIKFVDQTDSADKRFNAKSELIQDWIGFRKNNPDKTACILAHTNQDVADLNDQVRSHLRLTGEITGKEFTYVIEHMKEGKFGQTRVVSEERSFAVGDQIVFTGTNKGMGVYNGSLGRITSLNKAKIQVEVENKVVSFSPNLFKNFDLGWAMTIHKSQGATVDEGFVLGSRGLYSNLTYVALTRHRDNARLYLSQNEFDDPQKTLSWLTRNSDETILSQIMTSDQIVEGMKKDREVFKDTYQSAKNTLSAIQYVGSRKLKEWTGDIVHANDSNNDRKQDEQTSQTDLSSHTPQDVNTKPVSVDSKREERTSNSSDVIQIQKDTHNQDTDRDVSTFSHQDTTSDVQINTNAVRSTIGSSNRLDRHEFSQFLEKINDAIQGEDLAKDLLRSRGLNSQQSNSNQLRFGEKGSLSITVDGSYKNTWYDFESSEGGNLLKLIQREQSCDFKASVSYAADYCRGSIRSEIDRFLDGKSIDRSSVAAIPQKDSDESKDQAKEERLEQQRQKIVDVNKLVELSVPLAGSPAETYLRHERNIRGDLPDSLRYIPANTTFTYSGKNKSVTSGAMISIAKSPEGETKAVQLTYLSEDGRRARNNDGEKFAKITYGSAKGAYVTLQEGSGTFIIAEGVETALSVKEAGIQGTVVCSLGIGNYKNIIKDQKDVVIAADWDGSTEMPTYVAAEKAKAQVEAQGGTGHIILPVESIDRPQQKTDFNDVLQEKGLASVKELLNNQADNLLIDKKTPEETNEPAFARDQEETASHQHRLTAENAPQMGEGQSVEKTPEQDPQEILKQNILTYFKHELSLEENAFFPENSILDKASNDPLDTLKWWQEECGGSPFKPTSQSKATEQDPHEALKQNILAYFKHELSLEENAFFPEESILNKASNDPLDTLKWWQEECGGSPFEPTGELPSSQNEVEPLKDMSDLFAEKITALDEYIDLLSSRKGYEDRLDYKESERSDLLNSASDSMLDQLHTKYPEIAERVEQQRLTTHQREQSRGHDMSM